jgi:adenylate cyclase
MLAMIRLTQKWSWSIHQWVRSILVMGLLVAFGGHTLHWWHLHAVGWVERGLQDTRIQTEAPSAVHPRVVIFDIDERSLADIGRWPWPRDQLAQMLDRVFGPDCQVMQAVGLDLILAEPDREPGADAELAKVMGRCPVSMGWFLSLQSDAISHGQLPMPILMEEDLQGFHILQRDWVGHTSSLEAFDAVASSGLINSLLDSDGLQRRVPLILPYKGNMYESLALSVWRSTLPPHTLQLGPKASASHSALAAEYLEVVFTPDSGRSALRIPLDRQGAMAIQWRGQGFKSGGGFEYISLTDVLHGRVDEQLLQGRIGLLGSSSAGLMDLRATPVSAGFPGVEIHALALASLLDQTFLITPPHAVAWELAALLFVALVGIWGLRRLPPILAVVMTIGLAITLFGMAEWFRQSQDWIMPVAGPLLFLGAIFLLYTVWGYWQETQSKRQFVALFGQYVPPQLVEKMSRNPTQYSMSPKRAELTILFSDVRGFTSISEQLSPDDLRDYINQYLSAMSRCISDCDGTLDKFIGDAVMAFWGAPVEQATHAQAAVEAALKMLETSHELSQQFVARGWPAMTIGIGLNTGDVRVGDMGSTTRRAYTVMGDPVNLASRLESLTKRYGAGLLVGESTMAQVPGEHWLMLDRVRVKGKETPVCIFIPIRMWSKDRDSSKAFIHQWNTFYEHYRKRQWSQARAHLHSLSDLSPQIGNLHLPTLIDLYSTRLDTLQATETPDGWDGITNFEDK